MPGPILLSWSAALTTMALQAACTSHSQLALDAASFWSAVGVQLEPVAQLAGLYATLWATSIGYSFLLMQNTYPAETETDALGNQVPKEVPHRSAGMKQHQLTAIDYSYVALNSMCMPGLFYHFFILMRSWGLDLSAPPMFGIYPESPTQLLCDTAPSLATHLSVYFLTCAQPWPRGRTLDPAIAADGLRLWLLWLSDVRCPWRQMNSSITGGIARCTRCRRSTSGCTSTTTSRRTRTAPRWTR
jgi:hypothetical protein